MNVNIWFCCSLAVVQAGVQ